MWGGFCSIGCGEGAPAVDPNLDARIDNPVPAISIHSAKREHRESCIHTQESEAGIPFEMRHGVKYYQVAVRHADIWISKIRAGNRR